MASPRQALILIHGIGEQRPMETLRGFVDAVLDQQPSISQADAKYYSKPDLLADNLELRRLVSAGGRGDRTDFFEYYWAHLMPTATWDRLASWYRVLMWRRRDNVPAQIKPLYYASWAIAIVAGLFGLIELVRFLFGYGVASHPAEKIPWLLILIGGIVSATVRSYVGDAAVYLSPNPPNIEARQKIRASGLALLDRVVASGRYDRIIVVGHSLGSVIGYDILTFAWQRHIETVRKRLSNEWKAGRYPDRPTKAIRDAEKLAKAIRDVKNPTPAQMEQFATQWRAASRAIDVEQRANGDGWLVTDFVTLGSPLAHGALLLAKDMEDFRRRGKERELPHCPPVRELNGRFSFDHKDVDDKGRPQHATILNQAAGFAVTAWTNLYFPCRNVLIGDLVGGPVAPLFWPGVRDIPVATATWQGWLAHTHYWERNKADTDPRTAPVLQLRVVLDLARKELGMIRPPAVAVPVPPPAETRAARKPAAAKAAEPPVAPAPPPPDLFTVTAKDVPPAT